MRVNTPEIATVVWVGHDQNESLRGGGSEVAGPIFARYMEEVSKKVNFSQFYFDETYNFHIEKICRVTGLIAIIGKCKNIDHNAVFIGGSKDGAWGLL